MDIKIGDKVRFNQIGLDTPYSSEDWCGIGPDFIDRAKRLGIGTVTGVYPGREKAAPRTGPGQT